MEAERMLEANSSVPIGSIKEPEHTNRRHMFHGINLITVFLSPIGSPWFSDEANGN
jgi:hypothetical protein